MNKKGRSLEEQILYYLREQAGKPLPEKKLRGAICKNTKEEKMWKSLIADMLQKGDIIRTRRDFIGLPKEMNLVTGKFAANAKGYGFVIPDDENMTEDIFVPPAGINGAMNGDQVICRVQGSSWSGKGKEGKIIRILERAHKNVVGTFENAGAYGFVLPDDTKLTSDVFISDRGIGFAKHGDKVIVQITKWPERGRSAEGVVIDVLGRSDDPKVAMESIIFRYGIHQNFSNEVLIEAESIPEDVPPTAKRGRRDLRDLPLVTIDGEDARDLDDAVYVRAIDSETTLLGVHIADVSYYVRPKSELDKEGYERGTSVYFPDRVIPMLPKELSNGICSLNAGVDRLAFSCEMLIDRKGNVSYFEIFPSVIRVAKRLSYPQVTKALVDRDVEVRKELEAFLPMLEEMSRLSGILRKKRLRRGAIDFDFPELKVVVDDAGNSTGIQKRIRNLAESIIEEFMLAANETVAQFMSDRKKPFVYRIHEKPASDKISAFDELLHGFGYQLKSEANIEPKALQEILEKVKGSPEERLISTVMLRSLRQAVYKEVNEGHFGLAAKYYTHFTSPIRRYPDLLVHRLLKSELGLKAGAATPQEKNLDYLAVATKHASDQERNAASAEREATDLKMVEYMEQFIGETFSGFISGVTAFGIFVEIENGVEGLIHISHMSDDYYQYFEKQWKLVGQRTGREFRLGDPIEVRLVKASPEERQLTFYLAEEEFSLEEAKPKKTKLSSPFTGERGLPGKKTTKQAGVKKEKVSSTGRKNKKPSFSFKKKTKR